MTLLYIVRHGESVWNADGRLQGQADVALSARGRDQVLALRRWLSALSFDRVVASDLARTRETAALLGFADADLDPGLREIDVGTWQGEYADRLDRDAYLGWRRGRHTPAGGESWEVFCARVTSALEAQVRRTGNGQGRLLIVAHGGVVRALMSSWVGLDLSKLEVVASTAVTILSAPPNPKLISYNLHPNLVPATTPAAL